MTEDVKGVRAILRGARERNALAMAARRIDDPLIGDKRDGIAPGEWGAPPDMPPDCPVQPLGMDGDLLFTVDALGQLTTVQANNFSQGQIQRLFGDRIRYVYWAWPRRTKEGGIDNFRAEKVRESLYGEAFRRGMWNATEKVRGRGAWTGPDGQIIYHCGDYLWTRGRLAQTGEIDGMFYPKRAKIPHPWEEEVGAEDNPAIDLVKRFKTWNTARPEADPFLILGWMAAGMLSGALRWRPSMFLIGDKAVGKSTLQGVLKEIMGPGLIQTPNTSEAGIYQRLGMDALPVAIDELEAGADNRRVLAVLELARIAASGGLRLRGGQDHKGIEFQARSSFFFSAINPPPMPPQDWSRLSLISLKRLDPTKIAKLVPLKQVETIGPKILRRLLDHWGEFDRLFEAYAAALRDGGHDTRGQDTYGTFLACAHLALGDEGCEELGYPIEEFGWWGEALAVASLPEMEDITENWFKCLSHLLTHRIDAWRGGAQTTIGAVLDDLRSDRPDRLDDKKARELLGQIGLGIVVPGKISALTGYVLAVPNSGASVGEIYRGTTWSAGPSGAGVWGSALRQGPENVIITDKEKNRVRINAVEQRCTLVDLDEFDKFMKAIGMKERM